MDITYYKYGSSNTLSGGYNRAIVNAKTVKKIYYYGTANVPASACIYIIDANSNIKEIAARTTYSWQSVDVPSDAEYLLLSCGSWTPDHIYYQFETK